MRTDVLGHISRSSSKLGSVKSITSSNHILPPKKPSAEVPLGTRISHHKHSEDGGNYMQKNNTHDPQMMTAKTNTAKAQVALEEESKKSALGIN